MQRLRDFLECYRRVMYTYVPFKGVLALSPEKVNMGLELQFEDVLLVNVIGLLGGADRVAEQREASKREIILENTEGGQGVFTATSDFSSLTSVLQNPRISSLPDESCRRTSRSW